MKIYADIVFLINFIMNVFILWIVNVVAKKNTQFYKITIGGFLMALLYSLLIFFTIFKPLTNIFLTNLILFVGVATAFKLKNLKEFLKLTLYAYVSAFGVGGIGMALFFYSNINNLIGNITGFNVNNFSIKVLISSTSIFYILLKLFLNWKKKIGIKRQIFYTIKIYYKDKYVLVNSLVDTGNSLCDPISKAPVIIAEFNSLKHFLPDEVKLIFYENKEGDLSFMAGMSSENTFTQRLSIIPFVSLGQSNGMLICFRPDKVEIQGENTAKIVGDTIIGIYNNKLSATGNYQGLLNPKTIY